MKLTIFNALTDNFEKFPNSPYKDNTFNFYNSQELSLEQAFKILSQNYTLVNHLNLENTIRTYRQFKTLKPYFETQNYLILDIQIKSKESLNQIINYFKKYSVILGESRSFNSKDNFDIKGILLIEESRGFELKKINNKIKEDIEYYGELDNRTFLPHYISPLTKFNILYQNNGEIYKHSNIVSKHKTQLPIFKLKSKNYKDLCKEYFKKFELKKIGDNLYQKDNIQYKYNPNVPNVMLAQDNINHISIKEPLDIIQKNIIQERLSTFSPNVRINEKFLSLKMLKPFVKEVFKDYNVLALKSYMGSAKSELIKCLITEKKKKVLVITSRVSLAVEFNKKFKIPVYLNLNFSNTHLYHKINYNKGDSLICQYDSLFKINPKDFDIVILDEFVSILLHSIDNLSKNKKEIMEKFLMCLNHKKVVVSDAFLNDYLLELFEGKVFKLENIYRDLIDIKERNLKDFFGEIGKALDNNEKITISTTSLSDGLLEILDGICSIKGKTKTIITGKTGLNNKNEFIEEFNSENYKNDILIFSPVVTIGVSIQNDIKKHFHYDSSKSVNTIQSIQMLGRSRKIEKIFYFVADIQKYTSLDTESDEKFFIENRIFNAESSFYLFLNEKGEMDLNYLGKYHFKIRKFLKYMQTDTNNSFNTLLRDNFNV